VFYPVPIHIEIRLQRNDYRYIRSVRDSDIVALIVAGDPEGLAQAFDRYATPLFAYCSAQLRDPADAAAVVRDTFRMAASRLDGLREPERLRSWLYAVARIQCLGLIESGAARSAVGVPPEEPAQLPARLRTALGGLSQGERDVVLLTLWQGLGTRETAAVLGVSRLRLQSLLTRARGQLGRSLGALFVARTGRKDCDPLDALLTEWDGQLTEVLRKRLSRHIRHCTACTDRQRRELQAALLDRAPGTALTGVLTEAYAAANIPPWLRDAALSANPAGAEAELVPSHFGTFRKDGFPQPATPPQPWIRTATLVPAIAVAVVALMALTATVIALDAGSDGGNSAIGAPPGRGQPNASDLYTPGGGGGGDRTPGSSPGGPGPSGSTPGTHHTAGVIAVTTSPTPRISGTGSRGPSAPSNSATAAPTAAPSPSATSSTSAAASPAPSPGTTSTPVSQGTLSVSPSTVALTLSDSGTITLTAENGPVSWSIAEPSSLLGELTVAPAAGTLEAGQSTQVTITVSGLASLDTQLTVSPGDQQVTVLLGVGL
jgi:RNA polymerase sigma factor (sigma-70 family)